METARTRFILLEVKLSLSLVSYIFLLLAWSDALLWAHDRASVIRNSNNYTYYTKDWPIDRDSICRSTQNQTFSYGRNNIVNRLFGAVKSEYFPVLCETCTFVGKTQFRMSYKVSRVHRFRIVTLRIDLSLSRSQEHVARCLSSVTYNMLYTLGKLNTARLDVEKSHPRRLSPSLVLQLNRKRRGYLDSGNALETVRKYHSAMQSHQFTPTLLRTFLSL